MASSGPIGPRRHTADAATPARGGKEQYGTINVKDAQVPLPPPRHVATIDGGTEPEQPRMERRSLGGCQPTSPPTRDRTEDVAIATVIPLHGRSDRPGARKESK